MNAHRLAALLTLPAAVLLGACTSSSGGSGTPSTASSAPPTSASAPTGAPTSAAASTSPSNTDAAAALVTRMQSALGSVTSAHFNLDVTLAGQSLSGTGDEKLSNGKLVAAHVTENLPGGAGAIEIVLIDGKTYAKLPATLVKTTKPWVLVSTDSSNPVIKQLAAGLDTALSGASVGSVSAFAQAAQTIQDQGSATVAGQHATHYHVVVDVAKLPDTVKSQVSASGLSTLPMELYIDDQGRPVQFSQQLSAAGQQVSTKVVITGYNKPVSITAPPAGQVGTS